MVVTFELDGKKFMGLNGGPHFKFNEAVSFVVDCETQEEIDHYWTHLTADGGQESNCGWLKDKFGVSWQIVPAVLPKLMSDPKRAGRVMEVYLKMKKFDIQALENA
jgi:predicted 3-demethylubiquinone-9 3-methyltransferase (glyoxalase superfamily)